MKEKWRDVVGYEGIYEVSNKGRVRTHKNKTTYTKKHGVRHWKQRYLKDKTPNGRDVRVSLWKDGKHKDFLVHRLVAFAFMPVVKGKECINHIDGNPKNNNVENLEWCNHLENNRHAFETGLMHTNMAVKLINHLGIEYEFISMSRASQFLGRNNGYISTKLKRNRKELTDIHGNKYKFEKLI
ncbi:NUMOD4 domain-containing protein [Staphylococcus sp. FR124]|uniref:NUMOD4 domain-containing protein n=1 Tax=Staphylococcus TaxID=1279 RepID=UPI000A101ECC|nr:MULTISPECIES: NUMOD4 domain-containing protein [Staphylococcus]ARM67764.1 HNH homing endonuclease [Staphylococcus phage IME1318_01]MCY1577218.1 NUMOD4 motif-containing HNH endonuclease [Staphylococcus pettenkoferi]MDQ8624102.1 NUMOD4 domain-containing protein [Staphylococcus sp. FR124]